MMMGHAIFNAQDSFMKWERWACQRQSRSRRWHIRTWEGRRASTELSNSYQNVKSNSRNSSEADEEALGSCCGMGVKNSPEKKYGATEKTKLKEKNVKNSLIPCDSAGNATAETFPK
jgi:hypothetical protein